MNVCVTKERTSGARDGRNYSLCGTPSQPELTDLAEPSGITTPLWETLVCERLTAALLDPNAPGAHPASQRRGLLAEGLQANAEGAPQAAGLRRLTHGVGGIDTDQMPGFFPPRPFTAGR